MSRGYYARRGPRAELAFFWRLVWPGFAFIIAVNTLLDFADQASMPLYVSTPGAIATMLAAAYWRDYHADGKKLVELHARDRVVVHVIRDGRIVDILVFGPERPNPLSAIPDDLPFAGLASAAVIEYVAGDITLERLEADLDRYMRP